MSPIAICVRIFKHMNPPCILRARIFICERCQAAAAALLRDQMLLLHILQMSVDVGAEPSAPCAATTAARSLAVSAPA